MHSINYKLRDDYPEDKRRMVQMFMEVWAYDYSDVHIERISNYLRMDVETMDEYMFFMLKGIPDGYEKCIEMIN